MRSHPNSYTPVLPALCGLALLYACGAEPQTQSPVSTPPSAPDVVGLDALDLEIQPYDTEAKPLPDAAPGPDATQDIAVPAAILEERTCLATFEYQPDGPAPQSVHVAGAFNGWDVTACPLVEGADGSWSGTMELGEIAPGSYGYKFVVNGDDWRIDETNMMRRYDDGFV